MSSPQEKTSPELANLEKETKVSFSFRYHDGSRDNVKINLQRYNDSTPTNRLGHIKQESGGWGVYSLRDGVNGWRGFCQTKSEALTLLSKEVGVSSDLLEAQASGDSTVPHS